MKKAWFSSLVVGVLVAGCGSSSDDDLAAVAEQAISDLEQADTEAVSACETEAERCRLANASTDGLAVCQQLTDSCRTLEQHLSDVRQNAVGCWEEAARCAGEGCEEHADRCLVIGEAVGEARQPVIDCANHVQVCMAKAAGGPQQEMVGICGELEAACGEGVAAGSVERVRLRAQECLEEGDPTMSQTGDGSQAPAGDADPAASAGAAAQMPAGEGSAESGETIRKNQQACLDAVAVCGESAANPDADLARIRQSGEACDLTTCQP